MCPQEAPSAERMLGPLSADRAPERFVLKGRFARIGGQNLLFSPTRQQVFTLNDTAADIWVSLEEGHSTQAIASQIASCGVDTRQANAYVDSALRDWVQLDLIRPGAPPAARASHHMTQIVALPGVKAKIVYRADRALPAMTIFRHLEVRDAKPDVLLEPVEQEGRFHLFRNHSWIDSCAADELATVLKSQLLGEVLQRGKYEIALHAAALLRDQRALLLCGRPGAGKTTLTLALTHAGFGYAGDDVTLLDSNGRALGLPFAPAIKAGAWRMLSRYFPDLDRAPVFRRPDRKRVRYLVPVESGPCVPSEVGWIVLLHRARNADPLLEPIDPASALRGLLEGSFALGRKLTATAFIEMVEMIGSAEVCRLTYSRLEDAVDLIAKSCR